MKITKAVFLRQFADGTYHILNENIQQKDRYLRLPPKDFDG